MFENIIKGCGCVTLIFLVSLLMSCMSSCQEKRERAKAQKEYQENVQKQKEEAEKKYKKEERELVKRSLLEWNEEEIKRHNDLYQRRRAKELIKLPLSEWTPEEKNQNSVSYLEKLLEQYEKKKKNVERMLYSQKSRIAGLQKKLTNERNEVDEVNNELRELSKIANRDKKYPKKYPEKCRFWQKQNIFKSEEELGWFVRKRIDDRHRYEDSILENRKSLQALKEQSHLNNLRLGKIEDFILKLESALIQARIEQDIHKVNDILEKIDSEQSSVIAIQDTALSRFESEHTVYEGQKAENKKILDEVKKIY